MDTSKLLERSGVNGSLCGRPLLESADAQRRTALHHAVQRDQLAATKVLLYFGANPHRKNWNGDDALQIACLYGREEIFQYLVKKISYPAERLADAHELMGATVARDWNSWPRARAYWRRALSIREMHGTQDGKALPKRPERVELRALGNIREFYTSEQLDALSSEDAIYLQRLLVFARILGLGHRLIRLHKLFQLFHFSEEPSVIQYQVNFWRETLQNHTEKSFILCSHTSTVLGYLIEFIIDVYDRAFSQPSPKRMLRFCDLREVFRFVTIQLTKASHIPKKSHLIQYQKFNYIFRLMPKLIQIFLIEARNEKEKKEVKDFVNILVNENLATLDTEETLLHLFCGKPSYGKDYLPNYNEAIKLLFDDNFPSDDENDSFYALTL